jgi:hypothetical protein
VSFDLAPGKIERIKALGHREQHTGLQGTATTP